jgi:proline iminopeptidase
MKHIICLVGILVFLCGCDRQHKISGSLHVQDALFEYTAEGDGSPLVIFTGGENVGQKLFPKELKDNFVLIHADPSKIDSSVINDISLNDILEDLEKLRISIGVEKIGILGHSMFGLLPLEYALKYPNNISFAISTGSQPFKNEVSKEASRAYWEKEASEERKRIREQNWVKLENLDWKALSPTEQFITSYTADTPFRFYDPNFDQTSFWEGVEINMAFLYHYGGTLMQNFDNSEKYKNIKSPVLVLTGKYDFGAPYHLWEEFNGIIPNFTLKVYEHAGHNPFMEYPEDFTKDVLEWVKENE